MWVLRYDDSKDESFELYIKAKKSYGNFSLTNYINEAKCYQTSAAAAKSLDSLKSSDCDFPVDAQRRFFKPREVEIKLKLKPKQ